MHPDWFDEHGHVLTSHCPLPLDEPFTADQVDVSRQTLRTLVARGYLRRLLRGVYAASTVPDDMWLRARALALVLPPHAVVTDRTAAWLHGVDVLPRSSRFDVPPLHAFCTTDTRLERAGVESGRRGLDPTDVTEVHGIRTTTALRTALDLGRLLWRYDALAAIDGFLRIGVPHDLLVSEVTRFRGYRGVRQLRALAPLGDGRAESPGESALRLNWYDAGLPRPDLQMWVYDDDGVGRYRIDLGLEEIRYAVEYNGEEFHTREDDVEHDAERQQWCERERHWHFEVFTKTDVYDRRPDPMIRLLSGLYVARANVPWTPYGRAG